MDSETLSMVAGVAISLGFSYVPGLREWFAKRDSVVKSLVMLAVMVLVAAGAFALSCAQLYPLVACDKVGAVGLVRNLILALIANQGTYLLSPSPERIAAWKNSQIGQS